MTVLAVQDHHHPHSLSLTKRFLSAISSSDLDCVSWHDDKGKLLKMARASFDRIVIAIALRRIPICP